MSGWVQILIFVLIALGPAAGRIFQEVSKKRAQQRSLDEKERDMLTGRNVRGKSQRGSRQPQARSQADAAAAGLTPEQRATQRQARVDEWRAAESKYRTQAGQQQQQARGGRPSSPPPFVVTEDESVPTSRDADAIVRERRQRAIERMRLEQQKQRQTQQQRRQQQQTQQQRVARQRATAVVAGVGASKQGQANRHAGPHCDEPETPGESQVHRLVKDDQVYLELAMLAAQHANASRVIPAGAGAGGPIILNQRSLRQAFILKELLEPPLALRQ